METKSRWRGLAIVVLGVAMGLSVQGCFWYGAHDNWRGVHKGFAYETPEHTTMGHSHESRSYSW